MKRFAFAVIALAVLFTQNVAFSQSAQAAAIRSLDANALVGMTPGELVKKYGKPARTEPSEYGFEWYVYNRDYKNFFMAGVRDGSVVACYTNAKTLNYMGKFKLGSTKAAVRKALGTPISYMRSGNKVCALNNQNQKDVFAAGSDYVFVFYDVVKGGKVTSVMIVPKADEERAMIGRPALSGSLAAAYQRIGADLVNSIRVRSGLKKLSANSPDARLALSRSRDMRDRDYFDHITPAPDKLSPAAQAKNMGVKFKSLGENIAYGDHNAILAHEALMNSAGHRANILRSKYTKLGVGVACGGGRYVILTQIFTR